MSTGEWIAAGAVFIMAGVLFYLGIRHFRERGFLFNNAFLYADQKQRETMDKKPYYRQSAIVFSLLGAVFASIGLSLVFDSGAFLIMDAVLVIITILYAIVSTVRIDRKK